MGQLCEIAEVFYKLTDLKVRIIESKNDNPGSTTSPLLDAKTVFVKYRLDFDNRDYVSIEPIRLMQIEKKIQNILRMMYVFYSEMALVPWKWLIVTVAQYKRIHSKIDEC